MLLQGRGKDDRASGGDAPVGPDEVRHPGIATPTCEGIVADISSGGTTAVLFVAQTPDMVASSGPGVHCRSVEADVTLRSIRPEQCGPAAHHTASRRESPGQSTRVSDISRLPVQVLDSGVGSLVTGPENDPQVPLVWPARGWVLRSDHGGVEFRAGVCVCLAWDRDSVIEMAAALVLTAEQCRLR